MIKSLFPWRRSAVQFPDPVSGQPLYVIGDVHGRFDLLQRALTQRPEGQTVLVGDYVDRGEHSAEVLRLLATRDDLVCLMGNHEDMMLRFLDDPARHGPRWLRYGGLQTLASFGVSGTMETSPAPQMEKARDQLVAAMGPDLIAWLRALPSFWQSGNVAVVHAGADPAVAIDAQDTQALRWGHPDFETKPREDGVWVVYGHTIVDAPVSQAGRINVDTGAYATGRLTTAVISSGRVQFETTT